MSSGYSIFVCLAEEVRLVEDKHHHNLATHVAADHIDMVVAVS